MTVVDDKLFIVGGSCGSSYYKDFFIVDTDPAPEINICADEMHDKLQAALK